MDLERFNEKPLMGIVRGVARDALDPLLESAIAGGLETLEITMNSPGAPQLIARAVARAGDRLAIGAGTVLDLGDLKTALEAGASFVVSPTLVPEVVAECRASGVPVFPGALTPQEIYAAWRAGASMVKVFPASLFGPGYFAEIKGPFGEIPLLACGGISAETLPDYARCGADAFAFGTSVFSHSWIEAGEFSKIEHAIRRLVAALQSRAE